MEPRPVASPRKAALVLAAAVILGLVPAGIAEASRDSLLRQEPRPDVEAFAAQLANATPEPPELRLFVEGAGFLPLAANPRSLNAFRLFAGDRRRYVSFRARVLMPELGRFTVEDPAGTVDSANRYQALGGIWPTSTDPLGLFRVGQILCRRVPGSPWSTADVFVVVHDSNPAGDQNMVLNSSVEIATFGVAGSASRRQFERHGIGCGYVYVGPALEWQDPYSAWTTQGGSPVAGSTEVKATHFSVRARGNMEGTIRQRAKEWEEEGYCYKRPYECAAFAAFMMTGNPFGFGIPPAVPNFCGY